MNSKVEIKNKEDHGLWYDNNIDPYKGLAEIIAVTLKNSLISQKISFVDVPYRPKTKKSFLKKIEDKLTEKDYSPESMTDLAGIRVITLIESDVQKVCDLVSKMFNVHQADSVNKSEKLGEEKVGYRSVHFVCDVGEDREKLPEFSAYKGLCFEIQVLTALVHAWAEIEHDRGYKLGGKLPSHLNRRFKLLSGLLESADLEFNRLTVEIEEYAKKLNEQIKKNNLDYELTNVGLLVLLSDKFGKYIKYKNKNNKNPYSIDLGITELYKFGINNLKEFDKVASAYTSQYDFGEENSAVGFIRLLLMFVDINKYFDEVYAASDKKWSVILNDNIQILEQKYSREEIETILKRHSIKIIHL
jgi:ppGpp synthetase/RelA/SpoT-type nucleotidyltranferase